MNDDKKTFPYDEYIDGLEEAIYWHNAWFARGMRQLLLPTATSGDLLGHDAHLHCKLAGFFSYLPTPPGHEELKAHIEDLHQQMHTLMREALLESAEVAQLSAATLDDLEETQATFFITLHGLFRKVMEDRCAAQR